MSYPAKIMIWHFHQTVVLNVAAGDDRMRSAYVYLLIICCRQHKLVNSLSFLSSLFYENNNYFPKTLNVRNTRTLDISFDFTSYLYEILILQQNRTRWLYTILFYVIIFVFLCVIQFSYCTQQLHLHNLYYSYRPTTINLADVCELKPIFGSKLLYKCVTLTGCLV